MSTTRKRGWLNTGEGMAAYEWRVDGDGRFCEARFDVSDCSRVVSLEFDFCTDDDEDDAAQRSDRRKKIDTLYRAVRQFRAALLESLEACDE